MAIANWRTRSLFNNLGEVHAQIDVNYAPCSKKCKFCVFGWVAEKAIELSLEEVVRRAKTSENEGANAIFLMTTADYDFKKYVAIGRAVREAISELAKRRNSAKRVLLQSTTWFDYMRLRHEYRSRR